MHCHQTNNSQSACNKQLPLPPLPPPPKKKDEESCFVSHFLDAASPPITILPPPPPTPQPLSATPCPTPNPESQRSIPTISRCSCIFNGSALQQDESGYPSGSVQNYVSLKTAAHTASMSCVSNTTNMRKGRMSSRCLECTYASQSVRAVWWIQYTHADHAAYNKVNAKGCSTDIHRNFGLRQSAAEVFSSVD